MSIRTGVAAAIALPLAALIWNPGWVAVGAIVGGLWLLFTIWLRPAQQRAQRTAPVEPVRLPNRSKWVPGVGVGLRGWPPRPSVFLTLWRFRRWR